ncbi:vanillate O-demethylase monooxygenase subunit [Novosphingobium chloroacetimidivorans]|uniref:Vanillate O-demethylase monooxygenase subunit n=1 Tax=Novosphingobium chloroacetimidivorans TaxID=1428314 RepID=A0A7W7KDW6_9SPHN|nr:Rieske 2Fe-2S domain-containing protein [Novosphingobium chloroacetimidivorans]MBB4860283.1 vanillate O-demethylase monooxygenase subunit [Novosphingobium chloroacetimidivorans]
MWHLAGWSDEFAQQPVGRVIDGHPIVFWRLDDGTLAAIEDRCAHRHMPLSMGQCDGNAVRCPYHGLAFSSAGLCINVPGQDRIPDLLRVRAYAVHEEQGWSWVSTASQSEDGPGMVAARIFAAGEQRWISARRRFEVAAPAELIVENLLDTSHFGYVHGGGFKPDWWLAHRPFVTRGERAIEIDWWAEDLAAGDLVDQHAVTHVYPPGIVVIALDDHPPGGASAARSGEEPLAPVAKSRAVIAAVPVAPDSALILLQWSIPADEGASARLATIMDGLEMGFDQDRRIVEAQHANRARFSFPRALAVRSDAALLLYKRLAATSKSADPATASSTD